MLETMMRSGAGTMARGISALVAVLLFLGYGAFAAVYLTAAGRGLH